MNFVSTLPRSALILAVICAIAALCAGPGYRFGWWSLGVGFAVLRWAAYGAILATVLAIAGIVGFGYYVAKQAKVHQTPDGHASIETPFGSIEADDPAKTAEKMGIDVYPGADPVAAWRERTWPRLCYPEGTGRVLQT